MAEYIEKQAAISEILGQPPEAHYPTWYAEQIKAIPPADVRPVVLSGVWITPRKNYCAECGAKMKGRIEMRKIDACPYCGCEEAYVESYEHHVGAIRYRVCCPKCGLYLDSGYWQTADRAIEEWNNRTNAMWWIPVSRKPFSEYGEANTVLTIDEMGVMRLAEYVGGVWLTPDGEPITNTKAYHPLDATPGTVQRR